MVVLVLTSFVNLYYREVMGTTKHQLTAAAARVERTVPFSKSAANTAAATPPATKPKASRTLMTTSYRSVEKHESSQCNHMPYWYVIAAGTLQQGRRKRSSLSAHGQTTFYLGWERILYHVW